MDNQLQLPRWTERSFRFGYTPDFIPFLVERLRATAPRIEEMVSQASEDLLSAKQKAWSVKEHIGHLTDLEELHSGRLDDFMNHLEILRPADMTNRKTEEAHHNDKPTRDLVLEFRRSRKEFLDKLEALPTEVLQLKSMHPRLKQEVNIADILYFIAEHDNQHLTRIASLLTGFTQ